MWANPNVMAALPNIGGALCSTPQSSADAHILECRAVTLPQTQSDGAQMANFWALHFQRAGCSAFQTCILNPH